MAHPKLEASSIRNQYATHLQAGLALSLVFLLGVVHLSPPLDREVKPTIRGQETANLHPLQPAGQEHSSAAPPKPAVPQVVPEEVVVEPPRVEFNASLSLGADSGRKANSVSGTSISDAEGTLECGGPSSLQDTVYYPPSAIDRGLEGRVLVEFVVDERGEIKNPRVTDGASEVLNRAALRAVRRLECSPSRQQSRPVTVTMPAVFKLPERLETGR